MEDKVTIDAFQQVSDIDFNRFGQFPQDALDHIVGDIGITGLGYTGFPVTSKNATQLLVGPGRFYKNGQVYKLDGSSGVTIDLLGYLPNATRKYIAIVVAGSPQNTAVEPRTFLTDTVTRATISRAKSTISTRVATPGPFAGAEAPDPLKPTPPADLVIVAYVLVGNGGVISIETNTSARVPSISQNTARLDENDVWRATAGTQIDTLRSDLSNLAGKINGLASEAYVELLGYDMARVKELVGLPGTYAAWGADHFLDTSGSDLLNVDFLAKVDEGIRFPDFQIQNDQLGLLNPLDPNVVSAGNFIVPAYDKVQGISTLGQDAELSIANFAHTTVNLVQKSVTRTRVRFGPSKTVCTNSSWWKSGRYDPTTGIFKLSDGETFQVDSISRIPGLNKNHLLVRYEEYWVDTWQEFYWDSVVVPEGINGFVAAETFNNTQQRFLVELGLYFSRAASTGDVRVAIVECNDDGSPSAANAIAKTTIPVANIKAGPGQRTPVAFTPTLLDVKRYAIVIISEGNHYLYQTIGNKFGDGTLFGSTDGAYFAGVSDLSKDIAFDLQFAQFRSPRVEVVLNPLGLPGGIVDIDVLATTAVPSGASLNFAYQQNGVWQTMDETTNIIGLPAGLPFKAILLGTTAVMPGLGLLSNSRVRTTRPGPTFKHVSTARVMPSNVTTVRVRCRLEAWRGASHHTFGAKLRTGTGYATITTPASVVDTVAPDDPTGATLIRESVFTFTSPGIGSYKIELNGTTDNVAACFHVGERVDIGVP